MRVTLVSLRGLRVAVFAAEAGTVLLAGGAFVLSFTALRDLAGRSGIESGLAWLWPLIVDGIIVVATISAFALSGTQAVWYPWLLLILGAGVSVAANAIHAVVAAEPGVPPVLAASVASVPPLVLVASTHLTAILIRHSRTAYANTLPAVPDDLKNAADNDVADGATFLPQPPVAEATFRPSAPADPSEDVPVAALSFAEVEPDSRRELAAQLRSEGLNNSQIARLLGVNRSTVGRWDLPEAIEQEHTS